jgi:hypothetical protein
VGRTGRQPTVGMGGQGGIARGGRWDSYRSPRSGRRPGQRGEGCRDADRRRGRWRGFYRSPGSALTPHQGHVPDAHLEGAKPCVVGVKSRVVGVKPRVVGGDVLVDLDVGPYHLQLGPHHVEPVVHHREGLLDP